MSAAPRAGRLAPRHSFAIDDPEAGAALVIALGTAYIVSDLARRAHVRAQEAAARAREAREVGLLCDAELARMERFEPDRAVTAIAAWSGDGRGRLAVGTRLALDGASIAAQVRETGRPARVDSFAGATGPIALEAQALGIRASVGCPITVGGRLWGVIAASTTRAEPFPADTEARIGDFTELIATVISNAEARADLIASRQRLLTAGDDARRRVVRDLHDGAPQRFVPRDHHARARTARVRDRRRGRQGADRPRRSSTPRRPTASYGSRPTACCPTCSPSAVWRRAWSRSPTGSTCPVSDNGVGGARPDGSGLLGLRDRVVTLGGELELDSPPGGGTRIAVTLALRR